ncbi:unnamed protein product [Camellia sinensis]
MKITRSGDTALHRLLRMTLKDEEKGNAAATFLYIKDSAATSQNKKEKAASLEKKKENFVTKLVEGLKFVQLKYLADDRKNTPLHLAATMENRQQIRTKMASNQPDGISLRNEDGETPLFLAALYGSKDSFINLCNISLQEITDLTHSSVIYLHGFGTRLLRSERDGRDLREAHLQVLLGGSGYRSSNANSSNAVTDPFLSSLILNFPSSESEDISKSMLSSAEDSSVKSVTSSHRWKASFDPSLSYEEREKRKRQAAERAVFLQDLLVSTLEAIKCMHHSKRTMLTTDDVDSALNLRNVEVTEVPLPKAPLYTSIACHWLAIEGVQPASPENAPVEGAYRTALCKSKRGGFKDTYPDDLLAPVLRALIERTNLNPSEVGDVVETVPIRTVNRQCSSGLQAVADVAAAIKAGFYDIGIGAGLESMTTNPMAWEGSVHLRVKTMAQHQDCLLPTGVTSIGVHAIEKTSSMSELNEILFGQSDSE